MPTLKLISAWGVYSGYFNLVAVRIERPEAETLASIIRDGKIGPVLVIPGGYVRGGAPEPEQTEAQRDLELIREKTKVDTLDDGWKAMVRTVIRLAEKEE